MRLCRQTFGVNTTGRPVAETLAIGCFFEASACRLGLGPASPYLVNYHTPRDTIVISLGFRKGHLAFDSDRRRPFTTMPGETWFHPKGAETFVDCPENTTEFVYLAVDAALCSQGVAEQPASLRFDPRRRHLIGSSPAFLDIAHAIRRFLLMPKLGGRLAAEALSHLALSAWLRVVTVQDSQIHRPNTALSARRIARVIDYIEAELSSELTIADLAQSAGLTPFHFCRAFKKATGFSPHQYVLERRIARARQLLENTRLSLADIAYDVGFSSQAHMTYVFKRFLTITPGSYRNVFRS